MAQDVFVSYSTQDEDTTCADDACLVPGNIPVKIQQVVVILFDALYTRI